MDAIRKDTRIQDLPMDLRRIRAARISHTSLRLEPISNIRISGMWLKVSSADRHVMVKTPANHAQT